MSWGLAEDCAKIQRVGGGLTLPGSGVELFTTNLVYLQAEGVEVGFALGLDVGGSRYARPSRARSTST